MMKYTLYIVLLLMFCVGCENTWDNHYGYEEDSRTAGASLTSWELLNTMPEQYSKFITLIKRAGYDKVLDSERMLTIWAPADKYIPDEIMLDSLNSNVERFVKNHISTLPLFKTKLINISKIKSLAGKTLPLITSYNKMYIGGAHIYNFDIACTNGVIHEIAGILKPLQNLSEFLIHAGDEYQLFRDSLNGRNIITFRPDLSFPIGVDEVGQTIYDSVFDVENSLLIGLKLDDEDDLKTLCLPSNDVIHEAFRVMNESMKNFKRPFTAADSALCFEWIMRASVLNGKVDDFAANERFHSAFGAEIRPEKQLVRSTYEECSNGYVYLFEDLYLPISIFMPAVETWPLYLLNIDEEVNSSLELWKHTGAFEKSGGFLKIGGKKGNFLEFKPFRLNMYLEPEVINLLPGKYSVYGQFDAWQHSRTKIYINGEPQCWRDSESFIFPTSNTSIFPTSICIPMIDTLSIKAYLGYQSIVVKLEAVDNKKFAIQRMIFRPVGDDNY